jgi:RNA polymerase-associated protein CTR9
VEESLPPMYALLANINIARSREAPKIILPEPRYDNQKSSKSKDDYCQEATKMLNAAGSDLVGALGFLTRGVVQLASRLTDDAVKTFDGVLAEKPTNLVALIAKARILYSKRQYPQALKIFQRVLRLNPSCKPDPRIGIGLCLWALDDKAKARAAWQRSMEVNPDAWPSQLLLGIDYMNTGKPLETDEQQEFYREGTKMVEKVFKKHNKNAAASNILSYIQLQRTSHDPVSD